MGKKGLSNDSNSPVHLAILSDVGCTQLQEIGRGPSPMAPALISPWWHDSLPNLLTPRDAEGSPLSLVPGPSSILAGPLCPAHAFAPPFHLLPARTLPGTAPSHSLREVQHSPRTSEDSKREAGLQCPVTICLDFFSGLILKHSTHHGAPHPIPLASVSSSHLLHPWNFPITLVPPKHTATTQQMQQNLSEGLRKMEEGSCLEQNRKQVKINLRHDEIPQPDLFSHPHQREFLSGRLLLKPC